MIKHIPSVLHFPNYDIKVVKFSENDDFFGFYTNKTLELHLSTHIKEAQGFDKYTFCLFTAAALSAAIELKIGYSKMHILGAYLFHIFNNNKLKDLCSNLQHDKITKGSIKVPSFRLNWNVNTCDTTIDESHAGYLIPTENKIVISQDVVPQMKPVVLIHELIEWLCFYYGLQLSHPSIQTLAEYLTYIIRNNTFLD